MVCFYYRYSNNSKIDKNWHFEYCILSHNLSNARALKVLYISYDGMTDSLGQSQVLPYIQKLSENGCEFHIISLEKEEKYKTHKNEIKTLCEKHSITWHPLAYSSKLPVISAYGNYRRLRKKAFDLQREVGFDIAHCRSDIPGIIGLSLQQKWNVKFVFDMRGFWADERIEGGIWNISNPLFKLLYKYFKKVEITLFQKADAIVSLTEKGKKIIEEMSSLQELKLDITVIPCCVNLDSFSKDKINSKEQEKLRSDLSISENSTVFGYLGSIGTWYMLEEMLLFYSEARKSVKNPVFLFISGENDKKIIKIARKYKIDEKEIIVKSSAHSKVPLHISLFDYSLFFIRPTFSKSASSPTKQGELMAMEVPIICNAGVGDTDKIINRYHAGQVIDQLDEEHFTHFDINTINFSPDNARKGAAEWFSLERGSDRYLQIYQRILH